ncbi:MAG TPA: M23 family metallopeptidase [bacterium]
MIRRVAATLLGLAAVAALPVAAAGPALTVTPAVIRQGGTAEVVVTGVMAAWVRIRFAGRVWPLRRAGGVWRGFVGTDPLTAPGVRRLVVEAPVASGMPQPAVAAVRVLRVAFPTRRITLAPDRRGLLDPRLAQEEGRIVAAALRVLRPDPLWRAPFRLPVRGIVASPYGVISVYQGQMRGFHHGVDLAAPMGTPVYAANDGIVALAEKLPLSGNAVLIDHGMGIVTSYLHQSALLVRRGQRVSRGQRIGRVGSTGLSTGPHLHWGMRIYGVHVDPMPWITRSAP